MRRIAVLLSVVVLASLISVNQVSAFGWQRPWHVTRQQSCHYRNNTAVTHKEAPVRTSTQGTTKLSNSIANSNQAGEIDESDALEAVMNVMKTILKLENERLEQKLDSYEREDVRSYGLD